MKHVIVDCDNTMGVPGCDVDDGLATVYLMGNRNLVSIEGICTTYGNSTIDVVWKATERLAHNLGVTCPVLRGGAEPAQPISEAARFLAHRAAAAPGVYSVLATGSLTNLYGASLVDPDFFGNVKEIVVMGGITETLVINGRIMDELNFSCDSRATKAVLSSGASVTVITAQHCLPALFARTDIAACFPNGSWITQDCSAWLDDMARSYNLQGFHCWDLVAAGYLAKPDFFIPKKRAVTLNPTFLSVGYLEQAHKGVPSTIVDTPTIADPPAFIRDALDSWNRAIS